VRADVTCVQLAVTPLPLRDLTRPDWSLSGGMASMFALL
jgi:hypothetical protein